MKPLVSIIVPCFNQAQYLSETLDSIMGQTFDNWECIIIDDGSQDDTWQIASQYHELDRRFVLIRQQNQGLAISRNVGITNSHGKYILPLDSDDLIDISYISNCVYILETHPEYKLVYSRASFFGKREGEWILHPYDYSSFLFANCIFCSAMYRRTDFDKTCGYNKNMIYGFEDWDFWLSLLNKDDLVYQIPEILFHYRIKSESMSTKLIMEERQVKMYRQIVMNHPEKYRLLQDDIIPINLELLHYKEELERIQNSKRYRIASFFVSLFSR